MLLAVSVASAQMPQAAPVPTDHFRPPVCPGKHSSTHDRMADVARAEQEQGAALDHALPSAEPLENFSIERYRLTDYGDCVGGEGCYWADLDAQYRRAAAALDVELARRRPQEKLALVLDIDETSLSNYCEMKREDFGYILSLSTPWVLSPASAVAIPGALRLARMAEGAGVAVFFITGRPGKPKVPGTTPWTDQTEATAKNLRAAGYPEWAGLALRNGDENGMPTIEYKSQERQRIVAGGYHIVMSVGDQWSDLLGSPAAEVSIKLPNPFYFIP